MSAKQDSARTVGLFTSILFALGLAACGSGTGGTTVGGSGTNDGGGSGTNDGGGSGPSLDASMMGHMDAPSKSLGGSDATSSSCLPTTCAKLGVGCGVQGDGCGGTLQCGTCTAPQSCGGGGTPSACGGNDQCTPTTCAAAGVNCGPIGDGCGGVLQCGTCTGTDKCGATGMPGVCGTSLAPADAANPCVPTTCAGLGVGCGPAGDGCGNALDCGTCSAPQTCGGGSQPSQCGGSNDCVPTTCAALGATCGPMGDGCGGTLQCGTCTGGKTCGGGGVASQCGVTVCKAETCAGLGFNCGIAGDGCGGTLNCGSCTGGLLCGSGGKSNVCGSNVACTGLCLKQTTCAGTATTSVSGTVFAPNGIDPIYGALVYVPNAAVQPFTTGVSCESCSASVSGSPLVQAVTGVDGKFTLTNMPVGSNIPLVMQLGRWRRQVVIPQTSACVNTPVAATLTHFPQNHTQGDIPLMAFSTGSVDALECVFRKIGIQDSEFGNPGGASRLQIYTGTGSPGAQISGTTPPETQLWTTQAAINKYDLVLFSCQGDQFNKASAQQQIVIDYANAGGRVYATHYSYVWLATDSPFSTTAVWDTDQADDFKKDPGIGNINTSFAKGVALAQWLQGVGASTTYGQITLNTLRHDLDSVVAPSELWISLNDATEGNNLPMHYTFDTPVGTPAASQCGRVVFDDFHVEDTENNPTGGLDFPTECAAGAMTPQEKLLEFELFDLDSCVGTPIVPTCTPKTCVTEGFNCGPQSDGCGNLIQCGACAAPQTCGGGGTPGVCGTETCVPTTCAKLGFNCGPAGDGCGNELQCGTCTAPQSCGAGGTPGQCGGTVCTAETCASQGFNCGPAGDGCGGSLQCGMCPVGQACGAGGQPGVCAMLDAAGCTPKTCADLGLGCGPAGDGCGNEIQCGPCAAPKTCGGGGTPGQCGGDVCTPTTCASQNISCGPAGDGCGGELQCGKCTAPDTCGGGGTAGVCGAASGPH
jgi:hypothetical protein